MAEQQVEVIAPSGARVEITMPEGRRIGTTATGVKFAGGSFGRGFNVGDRGYHQFAVTYVVPSTTVDRFPVNGREVVVAESDDGLTSTATLIGEYHELMTVFAGPRPDRSRLTALFGSLQVTDEVAGMTVHPLDATLLDVMSEEVMVVVDQIATVVMPGVQQLSSLIPGHGGTPTRYGQVWRFRSEGDERGTARSADGVRDFQFLFAGPAGAAQVDWQPETGVTDDELLGWLDGLNVAWRPAA
jgi:hypothetical protein